MNRISHIRDHGFTLMEVLVALVVISIGLLGIASMQASAIASTHTSQTESLVSIEARSLADAMQANPGYWASGLFPASFTITNNTISDTALAGQNTDCGTIACTPGQLAGYDLQHWATQLNLQVPGSTATVACQASTPYVCSITVVWTQKATAAVNSGTQSTATVANNMSYTLVNQL
ncbi:MAG: type IV pilus modification protein PilV [Rhodanobacter sp.]